MNTVVISLPKRPRTMICKDPSCPDYGKSIRVMDGVWDGKVIHLEQVESLYNISWGTVGRFGLTLCQLKEFIIGETS